MNNSFTKKDFLRMYNVNRNIFAVWCEDLPLEIIKKTRQTFKPNEVKIIIDSFGMPPFANDKEKAYINLILKKN